MKKIAIILVLAMMTLVTTTHAVFEQDACDSLAADTLKMVFSVQPDAAASQMQVQLDMYVFNDGNNLMAFGGGYAWDNPNLYLDSAVIQPLPDSVFDLVRILYYWNDRDSSNSHQKLQFTGLRKVDNLLPPSSQERLWCSWYFTLTDWSVGDSIIIDTITTTSGNDGHLVSGYDYASLCLYRPYWAGPAVCYDASVSSSCCVGATGNVDCSESEIADGSDLSVLINHLFVTFEELCCEPEADMISPDGLIDGGDLSALIDHLFIHPEIPLRDCL
ncbi:MAG: hypothetical protein DRP45_04260 [Candidatus Zixiibacteriota bacterium]|nr:MAG: hypothetical protein DRP45_04260 [candidate division Zixibacteria bacterium]